MVVKRKRRRRRLAVMWVLAVLVAGFAVNLYLALRPQAIELRVRKALAETLACPFEFDSLSLNLKGVAEVRGFRLLAGSGGVEVLRAGSIRVVPRLPALLTGQFEAELLVIQDLELRINREREGGWNFERLLRRQEPGEVLRLPDAVIERCRIFYSDASTFAQPMAREIRNLRLVLASDADGVVSFDGEVRDDPIGKLEVSGTFQLPPNRLRLDLDFRVFQVDLASRFDAFLPRRLADELRTLNLKGHVDNVSGHMIYDERDGLEVTNVGGSLVGCRLAPSFLPFPLKSLNGRFHLGGRKLELEEIRGDFGGGRVQMRATFELSRETFELVRWEGLVRVDSFPVDHRLVGLDPPVQKIVDSFQLQGEVGVRVEVSSSQHLPPLGNDVSVVVDVHDGEFRYKAFPYRVESVRGKIVFDGSLLHFDGLAGRCGEGSIRVASGTVRPRRGGRIDLTLVVEGRPGLGLDERFRSALPTELKALWDDFQPTGEVNGEIHIRRDAVDLAGAGKEAFQPPRKVDIRVSARPRDARIMYRRFPYPLHGIGGEILWESKRKRVELRGLRGFHGDQEIRARGAVRLGEDSGFEVSLSCDSLTVDRSLISAIPEEGRKMLADFGLEGRVGADVTVFRSPEENVSVKTKLQVLSGSVRHVKFPYSIELRAGTIELTNADVVDFMGLECLRQAPWETSTSDAPEGEERLLKTLEARLNGSLVLTGSERRLVVDELDIARLLVDEPLVEALPDEVRDFVTNFGLAGTFQGRLSGSYFFDENDPRLEAVVYNADSVSSADASVDFGLKFRRMKASGRFSGGWGPGQPHTFEGNVMVEEASFNRLRLTNGEVVFVFGKEHPALGAPVTPRRTGDGYRIPQAFLARLQESLVRDTFQMSVHSDDVYGGRVDGFLFVDTGESGDLGADFVGKGLQASKASRDVFGVEGGNVSGDASGWVRFTGRTKDLRSLKGRGFGVIKDARLVEVPLFLSLLSVLNLNFTDAAGRSFFNEVILPYKIEGGVFRSTEIAILSPGVKLLGGGKMDAEGNLDLNLQPRVFSFQIPVVEQVFSLIKEGLAAVHVGGDLSKPKVEFRTAASLLRIPIKSGSPPERQLPSDLRKK